MFYSLDVFLHCFCVFFDQIHSLLSTRVPIGSYCISRKNTGSFKKCCKEIPSVNLLLENTIKQYVYVSIALNVSELIFQDMITLSVISRFSAYVGAQYLDVIVNASGQDLITGVIERHSQHLVSVLESVDRPFLTDVPQLSLTKHMKRDNMTTWSGRQLEYLRLISNKIFHQCPSVLGLSLPPNEPNDLGSKF